jgi:pyruvate dehydrogenase (quinone)
MGLPIRIVVPKSGTLGIIELEMKAAGFLDTGVALDNPDFAAMANAMGIKGICVKTPQALRAALAEALGHDGPALVDVVSSRQELLIPPKTSFANLRDFGLFMVKAVMDERA